MKLNINAITNSLSVLSGVIKSAFFNRAEKRLFSINEVNNIAGILNNEFVMTKNGNLVRAIKIEGVNYSTKTQGEMEALLYSRNQAFTTLDSGITLKILAKRREAFFKKEYENITDGLARAVIEQWENKKVFYNDYYIIFELDMSEKATKLKSLKEGKEKEKTSKNEKEEAIESIGEKAKTIDSAINKVMQNLVDYEPKIITAEELMRIYAEYSNGFYIPIMLSQNAILTDSYLASEVEFKKDYFIQTFHGQQKFGRIIAVKTYEVEKLGSNITSNLLHIPKEIDIIVTLQGISPKEGVSKLKNKIRFTFNPLSKSEMKALEEYISTGRINLLYVSYNIIVRANTKEELEENSQIILDKINSNGWVSVRETINLIPSFFSFYPNQNKLNARLRLLTSLNYASMFLFEKENGGFAENSWGDKPLTIFKNQSESPFMFNFHSRGVSWKNTPAHSIERITGHTLLIGTTGAGKTTLMSFLMMNCLKYPIDIIALDSLAGLYPFTKFFNGSYNGFGEQRFSINPFSLPLHSKDPKDYYMVQENREFLTKWIKYAIGLSENDEKSKVEGAKIQEIINNGFDSLKIIYEQGQKANLKTYIEALTNINRREDSHLAFEINLESLLKKEIFFSDNVFEDSLDFSNRITAINIDGIKQNEKDLSLLAFYLFHKIITRAKYLNRGFFLFVDEFRTFMSNKIFVEQIEFLLTQARKANGVLGLALQNMEQLMELDRISPTLSKSFIKNIAHLIIYPQKGVSVASLEEKFEIKLTEMEADFLQEAPSTSRRVLVKNMNTLESNIVDVNLAPLGYYLPIFTPNTSTAEIIHNLEKEYQSKWKMEYLNQIQRRRRT